MSTWIWIWLVIAVLAAIGEALTYDLFLASVSVAALISAAVALVFLPWPVQIALFAALALVGITFVRPAIKHALGIESLAQPVGRVRHGHVMGRRAIVTRSITSHSGQVRIGQGEFWTARAYEPDEHIEEGADVEIVLVEGLTALVERVQRNPDPASSTDAVQLINQKGN